MLSTGDQISIGVALFNAVVVPGGIFMLKSMIDKAADQRNAVVRKALEDHEGHDDKRFGSLAEKLEQIDEKRSAQHVENRETLAKLSTDFDWLKRAILHAK